MYIIPWHLFYFCKKNKLFSTTLHCMCDFPTCLVNPHQNETIFKCSETECCTAEYTTMKHCSEATCFIADF